MMRPAILRTHSPSKKPGEMSIMLATRSGRAMARHIAGLHPATEVGDNPSIQIWE